MNAEEPTDLRILIVDDHEVVYWGLRLLLERQAWVESCKGATDLARAVEIAERWAPDIALVDLMLGDDSGAEACAEIRTVSPETKVLLISGAGMISPAVAQASGASGFVTKDWGAVDVVKAVRVIALGREVFAPETDSAELSDRQREVLTLMATGASNREIGAQLHLSPHTVKEHASAIYKKLGVRNRAEAVRTAQARGIFL